MSKRNILLCLLALFSPVSYTGAQETVRHCPPVCMCDNVERFAMCIDKGLYTIPWPLPVGTKMLGLSRNQIRNLSSLSNAEEDLKASLESLILYDNQITSIPPGSFQGFANLQYLWLSGNELQSLERGAFSGLETLTELDLSRNNIDSIAVGAFKGLDSLRVLQLWRNNIKTIPSEAFSGLTTLSNLTLGENKMEEVPTNAFHTLSKLTSLEILNLPVTRLEKKAFSPLAHLQKLHIGDWPWLRFIDDEAFMGLDELSYLSLYDCNLDQIPREAMKPLTNLQHLLLNNNPHIKKLKKDDFQWVPNLETLYLANDSLEMIHESPFQNLIKLRRLDLSRNHIKTLPNHIFFKLENLQSLNISHNNIKALGALVITPLNSLHELDLTHNPTTCDCDIKWLKFLQERKIRRHFNLKGKCSEPRQLEGLDIVALPPRKFKCEPPSFVDKHKDIIVNAALGDPAWLPCAPDHGLPPPDIQWKFRKKVLNQKLILKNGTLSIREVDLSDYGEYLCLASNRFGQDGRAVQLVQLSSELPATDQEKPGVIAAILITLAVVALIVSGCACAYKKRAYAAFRTTMYDTLMSDNEAQRLSTLKATKVN